MAQAPRTAGGDTVQAQPRGTFLDRFFDVFRSKEVPPEKTAGVSGASVFAGTLRDYEVDRDLTGSNRYKTYSEIRKNNPIVGLGVRYMLDLASKPDWIVSPADASRAAAEMADFVEDVLHDMATPWSRIVRRFTMKRFHGFGIYEWTAKKRDDGRIGFLDVEVRPQATIEKWDLDAFGTVHGVVQRSPQDGQMHYIPIGKCVHLVDDSEEDSPEGCGLFRHCVSSARRFDRYRQLEGFGYETDLRGVPIATAPIAELRALVKANPAKAKEVEEALQAMRDFISAHIKSPDAGFLLDSETYRSIGGDQPPSSIRKWMIELLQGNSSTSESVLKGIEREALYLAALMNVEHILIGGSNRGSQALSRDKATTLGITVDSELTDQTGAVETQLLRPLFKLNGFDPKLIPDLSVAKLQYRDVEQVTGALLQMAQAGAVLAPDDPAIESVRDLLGLPSMDATSARVDAQLRGRKRVPTGQKPGSKPQPAPAPGGATPKAEKQNAQPEPAPVAKAFDPDQERDDAGKWTSTGGGAGASKQELVQRDSALAKDVSAARADAQQRSKDATAKSQEALAGGKALLGQSWNDIAEEYDRAAASGLKAERAFSVGSESAAREARGHVIEMQNHIRNARHWSNMADSGI